MLERKVTSVETPGITAALFFLLLFSLSLHSSLTAQPPDTNKVRIDDSLVEQLAGYRRVVKSRDASMKERSAALEAIEQPVEIEIIFRSPPTPAHEAAAAKYHARIRYRYRHAAHGWLATAPLDDAVNLAHHMGRDLELMVRERSLRVTLLNVKGPNRIEEINWPASGEFVPPSALDTLVEEYGSQTPDGLFLEYSDDADPALLSSKANALWALGIPAFAPVDAEDARAARGMILLLRDLRARQTIAALPPRDYINRLMALAIDRGGTWDFFAALDAAGTPLALPWQVELDAGHPIAARRINLSPEAPARLDIRFNLSQMTIDAQISALDDDGQLTIESEPSPRGITMKGASTEPLHAALVLRLREGAGTVSVRELPARPAPPVDAAPLSAMPAPSLRSTALNSVIAIDGSAEEYGAATVTNSPGPSMPHLTLTALRVAHDNDFLYLHLAATAPADRLPSCGYWIFFDSVPNIGAQTLANPGIGPVAITAGMEGVVLEKGMLADRLLFIENDTTTQARAFAIWMLDYAARSCVKWGVLVAGPPPVFSADANAPVGFDAAFANAVSLGVQPDSSTGIEVRVPLSALGISAPLMPGSSRQPIRLFAGAGRGDTGEWSNQVLPPVHPAPESGLGGGVNGQKPDFARDRAFPNRELVTFEGMQAVEYAVEYVRR